MITENELTDPIIELLARAPGDALTTTELREMLKDNLPLSEADLRPLRGRPDTRIDQIIRNVKSHKKSEGNPFYEGLIEEQPRGFRLTSKGKIYAKKISKA